MQNELVPAKRGTFLRKNGNEELEISLDRKDLGKIFLINEVNFKTEDISKTDLIIEPYSYYMIINKGNEEIELFYSLNISDHEIVYNPYKYENGEKVNFQPDKFKQRFHVPEGYIDTLPKWYSFKFTYNDYNLIFVKPEMGLSIQKHNSRNETWEILEGNPIIINGNKVYYNAKNGSKFQIPIDTYHSIINSNKEANKFVLLKERWSGNFDENDITRVFNPNNYK